jgi:hypothetical protein
MSYMMGTFSFDTLEDLADHWADTAIPDPAIVARLDPIDLLDDVRLLLEASTDDEDEPPAGVTREEWIAALLDAVARRIGLDGMKSSDA